MRSVLMALLLAEAVLFGIASASTPAAAAALTGISAIIMMARPSGWRQQRR